MAVVWAALYGWIRDFYLMEYSISALSYLPAVAWLVIDFSVLVALRELWGWILGKCSLSWCLSRRLAGRCKAPQLSLLIYTFWIVASAAGMGGAWLLWEGFCVDSAPLFWCSAVNGVFALLCLWCYGADLGHFQKQLENYRKGQPISVGKGTFSETEAKLVDIQAQHQQAIQTAVTSERFKVELIANVSHDLRTPLTTIYSASSTLLDKREQLTDQQRDLMLKSIQEDSEWLVRMVENLLSITRIGSERIEIAKTPVILDELIDSAMTKFHSRYPGQEVALELPEDMVAIPVDAILIEQVLINLLENAVLHAEGMTTLSLRVFTLGRQAIFEVADNGCGIREDRLSHIFSGSYEALESTPDGRKRNAGIGLSVCATIIKAHGGEITAENRRGGGALFRFTLGKEDITDDE